MNHRVFERTLRPRGPPRGHVRLSVASVDPSAAPVRRAPPVRAPRPSGRRRTSKPGTSLRRRWFGEGPPRLPGSSGSRGRVSLSSLPAAVPRRKEGRERREPPLRLRPQLERDDPLNLNISISGGRETNQDSLSNGERSGKSSGFQSPAAGSANCGLETPAVLARFPRPKLTWNGASQRVTIP